MPLQPLARLNSGTAFFTPVSKAVSMPGFTSICAISKIMRAFAYGWSNIMMRVRR